MAASLVSIGFSYPFLASAAVSKGGHPCVTNSRELSCEHFEMKGSEFLVPHSWRRGIWEKKLCTNRSTRFSGNLHGTFGYCLNVDLSLNTVITGFWVGPDIDDGWGFIEAFVNQIS